MPMPPELAELLDQQQRDRRQLLLYSARLAEQVRKTGQLTDTIAELTEAIEATKSEYRREIEELQSRHAAEIAESDARHAAEVAESDARHAAEVAESEARHAAEVGELVAWRDTMMRSRFYRVMLVYGQLYRAPVLGPPLRLLRRAIRAVYVGLVSFRCR